MTDSTADKKSDRIPRGAIAVVIVGLIGTLGVLALDWRGGGTSAELPWTTITPVKTPPKAKVGPDGTFEMARTAISAIGQNGGDSSVFRVSGVLRVDTNGKSIPAEATCRIEVVDDDSSIARTNKKRASWPRPSNDLDLQKQAVPELSVVKFNAVGNDILGLEIRDVVNRYTNSAVRTTVEWVPFKEREQGWIWKMPNGTGPSPASLGYVVIFKTDVRPEATLKCGATIDGNTVKQTALARQEEWPLPEPDLNAATEAENAPDVE
ncbi:MAG: hypothetical protein WBP55_08930 [Solirubrobacterales bacterium]